MLARARRLTPISIFALILLGAGTSHASTTTIATAFDHSCAITTTGEVWCWGNNLFGQLGDGRIGSARSEPRPVEDGAIRYQAVAISGYTTCGVTTTGTVRCWGQGSFGALGNGLFVNALVPVAVSGLSGIRAIAGADAHFCALSGTGAVSCWGRNNAGQLGTFSPLGGGSLPTTVAGIPGIADGIATGGDSSCAVNGSGAAYCWGRNGEGQLGTGGGTTATPAQVTGLSSGVASIVMGGFHTCALMIAGNVKCWGRNGDGELGINSLSSGSSSPVDVLLLGSDVTGLALGYYHTCAINAGGRMRCFGDNVYGQLGDGSEIDRRVPVDVVGLDSGVQSIGAGISHTCALTQGGGFKCWGSNGLSQLGDNQVTVRRLPVTVSGLAGTESSVSAGGKNSCAVTAAGGVRCWGKNNHGGSGNGTLNQTPTPVSVVGLPDPIQTVTRGDSHGCALSTSGGLRCWGLIVHGALGNGMTFPEYQTTAVAVTNLSSGVQSVAAGGDHTCAVAVGAVKCWGRNDSGQVGDNSTTSRSIPADVFNLGTGFSKVAAGFRHSCALSMGGAVKCWGNNDQGQLGDQGTSNQRVPVDVVGLGSGVQAIAAGGDHSCAIVGGGGVVCWGANEFGELGNGTQIGSSTPVAVSDLGGAAIALALGYEHTCALLAAGSMRCWGRNTQGQLGDGSQSSLRTTPVDVVSLGSGVQSIAAGVQHSCALVAGTARCWGSHGEGQLGIGQPVNVLAPLDVSLAALTAGSTVLRSAPPTPSAQAGDRAGTAVAVGAEFVVVGAPGSAAQGLPGRVLVYRQAAAASGFAGTTKAATGNTNDGLELIATLFNSLGGIGDGFGSSVDVSADGNTIVIGAPGAAGGVGRGHVFKKPGFEWLTNGSPSQTLVPSSGAGAVGAFGGAVAIGDTGSIAIGAPASDIGGAVDAGLVQVFQDPGTGYTMSAERTAPQTQSGAGFGSAVGLSNELLVIGAPAEDEPGETDAGAAYLYLINGGLPGGGTRFPKPIDLSAGGVAQGGQTRFGGSVGVHGNTGVVGAPGADTGVGVDSGGAVVYTPGAGGVPVQGAVLLPAPGNNQGTGSAVAIDDDLIALGSPLAAITGKPEQGRVYLFENKSGRWSGTRGAGGQLGSAGNGVSDRYGSAVAIGSYGLVAGVPAADYPRTPVLLDLDRGRVDTYALDRISRGGFE